MSLVQTQADFVAMLLSTEETQLSEGEAIYHNAYRGRLKEALAEVHTKTWMWLGDESFEVAALTHIKRYHSKSWTLNNYGHGFCDTLDSLYPDDPEVAELAKLEWALHLTYAGEDTSPIDTSQLSKIDWTFAKFIFVPTIQFFDIQTNAPAIWVALNNQETPPQVEHLFKTATIMVWRKGYDPHFRTLDYIQSEAIKHLFLGLSFAEVCEALIVENDQEKTNLIASWLRDWMQAEIISEIAEI